VVQLAGLSTCLISHNLIISDVLFFLFVAFVHSYLLARVKCAHRMIGAVVGARMLWPSCPSCLLTELRMAIENVCIATHELLFAN
jgi:hypothetical protein